MLLDKFLVLGDAQAVTADAKSTDTIDLDKAQRAPGNPLRIKAHIVEAFNNLTNIAFQVRSSANSDMSSPVIHQVITKTLAELTLGAVIDLGELVDGTRQYVDVYYDITGTAPTLGKITAFANPLGDQTHAGQA